MLPYRMLLAALLLLAATPVATAQIDCEIDLTAAIQDLVTAQRAADTGDAPGSLDDVEAVRDDLTALIDACNAPATAESADLPQFATDGRSGFNYPDGWQIAQPEPSLTLVGTSAEALTFFESDPDEPLADDEQIVAVFFPETGEFAGDSDSSFVEAVREFRDDVSFDDETQFTSPIEDITINDRAASRITIESPNFNATALLLDFTEQDRVLLVLGVAPPGQAETINQLALDIATTFQSPVERTSSADFDGSGELQVIGQIELEAIIDGSTFEIRSAVLSPDGSGLAWVTTDGERAVCVYNFDDIVTTCSPIPDAFGSGPAALYWSLDAEYVAFTEDYWRFLEEPDVWLLDVEAGRVFNRTDDGTDDAMTGSPSLDAEVVWHPDGDLYVLRLDGEAETLDLVRLDPEGVDQPERVTRLSDTISFIGVFSDQVQAFDGALSFSPDGNTLALVVSDRRDRDQNGVWLYDLEADTLTQLAKESAFLAELPATVEENAFVNLGVAWTADGSSLYALAGAIQTFPPVVAPFVIDAASGAVTGVVDLSDVTPQTDPATLERQLPSGGAVIAPGGNVALGLGPALRSNELILQRITPDGVTPIFSVNTESLEERPFFSNQSTVSADGKVLMFGQIFTLDNR